jgi:cytochrome c nitrite reductase small subunit
MMDLLKPVLAAALALGAALGIGSYTFVYAGGASYMSNDAAVCANCHIMNDHYAAWLRSSHSDVASCNDCHTPPGAAPKYVVKAANGFRHSYSFTGGGYPDVLRITDGNRTVTEQACRKCHEDMTSAMHLTEALYADVSGGSDGDAASCVRCHANVGHWVR